MTVLGVVGKCSNIFPSWSQHQSNEFVFCWFLYHAYLYEKSHRGSSHDTTTLAAATFSHHWKLEQKIKRQLIQGKRETRYTHTITCTGQVPTSVTITITVIVIPCQVQKNKWDVFRICHWDLNSYKAEEIETDRVLFDLVALHCLYQRFTPPPSRHALRKKVRATK